MSASHAFRTWWKPWTWTMRSWGFAILLLVGLSPFITRWAFLWLIPDVALPFRPEELMRADVPDDQNAFVVYRNVMNRLLDKPRRTLASGAVSPKAMIEKRRAKVADLLTEPNPDPVALAEYLRAGEMQQAVGPSMKTVTYWTNLNLNQPRELARHYSKLGQIFEESGDLDASWKCHRANLQLSLHAEQPGQLLCAMVACAIRNESAGTMIHWASNPSVTADQLRQARKEISGEYARRIPLSTITKAEYLMLTNSLREPDGWEFLFSNPSTRTNRALPINFGMKALFWSVGFPELVLRFNRQMLVNHMPEIDKPLHLRRGSKTQRGESVFDADPDVKRVPGQCDVTHLTHIVENNSTMIRFISGTRPAFHQLDRARQADSSRFAALTVLFAAQEFQRDNGQFPVSLEELVPNYLDEIPLDPMDIAGNPFHYRREADGTAVVWGVGGNGTDDGGDVTGQRSLDSGFLIQINPPGDASK